MGKKELLEKYGGEEHMEAPRELLLSQNENYVEYTRDGRILKGRDRAYVKSKYEEDILPGNHSSIWGSWYDVASHQWGYACCRQYLKHAYCLPIKNQDAVEDAGAGDEAAAADGGAAAAAPIEIVDGGAAESAAPAAATGGDGSSDSSSSSDSSGSDDEDKAANKEKKESGSKKRSAALAGLQLGADGGSAASSSAPAAESSEAAAHKLNDKRSSAYGHNLEDVAEFDKAKVKAALAAEKKRRKETKQVATLDDERNRKYGGMESHNDSGEISAEELEAYRMSKSRGDDPMAKFV